MNKKIKINKKELKNISVIISIVILIITLWYIIWNDNHNKIIKEINKNNL